MYYSFRLSPSLFHPLSSLETGFSSLPLYLLCLLCTISFLYAASWGISSDLSASLLILPSSCLICYLIYTWGSNFNQYTFLFLKFKLDSLLNLPSHFYSLLLAHFKILCFMSLSISYIIFIFFILDDPSIYRSLVLLFAQVLFCTVINFLCHRFLLINCNYQEQKISVWPDHVYSEWQSWRTVL